MAENSKIEWTRHSWNPWRGCTKISPGCANCYAETLSGRNPKTLGVWGPKGTRVVAAESAWRDPLKWNKTAAAAGELHRVFCASLADVFEDWRGPMSSADGRVLVKPCLDSESGPENWQLEFPDALHTDPQGWRPLTMDDVRARLFRLIDATPHLDWLLLTMRPENILRMLPPAWTSDGKPGPLGPTELVGTIPHNVWLGTSVENQAAADERIPHLLRTPAAVRFLSCEPLLGPVDLRPKAPDAYAILGKFYGTGTFDPAGMSPAADRVINCFPKIDWVIVGGESGPGARPMHVEWVRGVVGQCKAVGVPVFVKQMGSVPHVNDDAADKWGPGVWFEGEPMRAVLADRKGGDMDEWPADLRVREFPEPAHA